MSSVQWHIFKQLSPKRGKGHLFVQLSPQKPCGHSCLKKKESHHLFKSRHIQTTKKVTLLCFNICYLIQTLSQSVDITIFSIRLQVCHTPMFCHPYIDNYTDLMVLVFSFQDSNSIIKARILTNVPTSQFDQWVWDLNTIYTNTHIYIPDRFSYACKIKLNRILIQKNKFSLAAKHTQKTKE